MPERPPLIPASAAVTSAFSRRNFLRGTALAGGTVAASGLLAACRSTGGDPGGGAANAVTVGVNEARGSGRAFDQQSLRVTSFAKNSDFKVVPNYVDHNTFQEQINNYLQGSPDDVFTWFAGYRMQTFAEKGLIGDISSIYPVEGLSDAFVQASTYDGKQYLAPAYNYPWAMFYFKSLWEENGYEVPTTLDEFIALSKQMESDGLTPIAFADKDGWPAMGTFDILDMRMNGYDYHVQLMAGEKSWTSPEVRGVFDQWRELLPYHQTASLGRTWQEATATLQQKKAGMYFLGLFLTDSLPLEQQQDIDFFTFPEIDSAIGASAIDAPIDGYCMSSEPRNEEGAKALLSWIASAKSADALNKAGIPAISANSDAATSNYTDLQKRAADFIAQQDNIAQFLDRDTDPAFASTVMTPALQSFIRNPDDVNGLTTSIEKQKKSILG